MSLKPGSLTNNSGTVAYKCFDIALTSAFRPASSYDYVSVYISPCSPGTTAIYAYLEARVPGCGVLTRYPVNFYIA